MLNITSSSAKSGVIIPGSVGPSYYYAILGGPPMTAFQDSSSPSSTLKKLHIQDMDVQQKVAQFLEIFEYSPFSGFSGARVNETSCRLFQSSQYP
jgi:hypothetical protein